MPSELAFILCLIFVVALLKLDHELFKEKSMASWIPTIWIIYCASKPLPYWFQSGMDINNHSIIEGSAMDRNFLMVLILIGLFILVKRKIDFSEIVMDNRWLILLLFYALISILWSEYPFVSLKRWIKTCGSIIMALVILTGPLPLMVTEAILRRTVYILIPFSLLLVKYFPVFGVVWGRWSGETMWVGATMSKNTLGLLCMISVIFLIWMWSRRRKQAERRSSDKHEMIASVIVLGLTFWLLRGPGGAYSATSIVVLIMGLTILFMLRRMNTNSKLNTTAFMFFLAIVPAYFVMWHLLSIHPLELIASFTGRDSNLTGRADMIWAQLIPLSLEHPLLGVGYGGYWIHPLQFDKLTVNQAHNGYLDIFIELGAVGLILFAIVIVVFFRKAAEEFRYNTEWGSFKITFLLMSLVHNMTESSYLKSTALLWNLFIIFMVVYERNMTRKQSHSTGVSLEYTP